ncbi:SDR family oxidoreductase [Nocardia gamkensis]|uniref:SDR family oxidoreductase n=1 Tax=Nocardia gamkensis TaxID=352869 RepID=UPI0037CAE8BE
MTSQPTSALITGGNKGLGLETARRLGEQGWTIFLGSRDRGRGQKAADQLTACGVNVTMIPLDVTSDQSVAAAVSLVREHTDRLDVLVNNAGVAGNIVTPAEVTVEEVHAVYNTNVYGPIRVTNAFLPLLRVTDNPRVVMVSSAIGSMTIASDLTQPPAEFHELAYSSSKAALNMITIRYAKALPDIKFNLLTPGEIANGKYTATDINNHTGQLSVTEGSDPIIELATLDVDGPTATFIDRLGPVPW